MPRSQSAVSVIHHLQVYLSAVCPEGEEGGPEMAKFDRNPYPYPLIQAEEVWTQPLSLPGFEYDWKDKVSPHDRLYYHNTLASIRQNRRLKHPCAPKDSLDIMLSTVYDHTKDSFLPKEYIYIQPDILGYPTYRLLRNLRYVPPVRPARDLQLEGDQEIPSSTKRIPGTRYFGIRYGGIPEKKSIFSVKLGITSNHSSTSNGGYSRKVDGTFFHS